MTIPLLVLAFFATTAGFVNTPARLTFEHFLEPTFERLAHVEVLSLALLTVLAVVTLVVAVVGIVWAWRNYNRDELPAEDGAFWQRTLAAFGVDEFYGRTIVAPGKRASDWASESMDLKVIDGAAHGIGQGVRGFGSVLARMQRGQVREYAGGLAVAGVVLIVIFLVVGGGF